jgi:anti-sigma factor RsiW
MMSDQCRELRGTLAAAALGRIDPGEELALQAHLDGCPECRAELRELRSVAGALPLADPTHVSAARIEPTPMLAEQVLLRVAHERATKRARSRHRLVGAVAAAVAVAAGLVAFAIVGPSTSPPAQGRTVALVAHEGATATATLRARDAGTEVRFHVSGLHDGDVYWLWLTDGSGERLAAGTFKGTGTRSDLVMTAGLPVRDVRRIWVTDEGNRVVLDARL